MKLHALLLGVTAAWAISIPGHVVHEKRFVDSGLNRGQRVEGTSIATFRIGLKQGNLDRGYDYLLNISHPSSEHYGKHWTAEDVRKAFAPPTETVESVKGWLNSFGIDHATEDRGWLSFDIPVADAERLFKAQVRIPMNEF